MEGSEQSGEGSSGAWAMEGGCKPLTGTTSHHQLTYEGVSLPKQANNSDRGGKSKEAPRWMSNTTDGRSTTMQAENPKHKKKGPSFLACLFPFAARKGHTKPGTKGRPALIPAQEANWMDAVSAPAAQRHVTVDTTIVSSNDMQLEPRSLNPLAGLQPEVRARILVVDDSAVCQRMVALALTSLNMTCDTAGNGKIACAMLEGQANAYDAVLMDLRMPVMDGIMATKYIRTKLLMDIPIIAFSAEIGAKTQKEVMEGGATALLCKPVSKGGLIAALERAGVCTG